MNQRRPKCPNCNRRPGEPDYNGYCKKCWYRPDFRQELKGRRRCVVLNCENYTDQGRFVGDLCGPCDAFVRLGLPNNSQAKRNAMQIAARQIGGVVTLLLGKYIDKLLGDDQ